MSYKRVLLVLLVFGVTLVGSFYLRKKVILPYLSPSINFEVVAHDFGAIGQDTPKGVYFVFTNSGIRDLKIVGIKTTCDCTTNHFPDYSIKKGCTDSVYIEYDALLEGMFNKQIYVFSNASEIPSTLYIEGIVIAE